MRHSMAAPRSATCSCVKGKLAAGRDIDLQPHQIEAGDQFGDRMLHLEAGIHFEEVEVAGVVGQELDCAGVVIAGCARGA